MCIKRDDNAIWQFSILLLPLELLTNRIATPAISLKRQPTLACLPAPRKTQDLSFLVGPALPAVFAPITMENLERYSTRLPEQEEGSMGSCSRETSLPSRDEGAGVKFGRMHSPSRTTSPSSLLYTHNHHIVSQLYRIQDFCNHEPRRIRSSASSEAPPPQARARRRSVVSLASPAIGSSRD